eukprot:gene10090-11942_t
MSEIKEVGRSCNGKLKAEDEPAKYSSRSALEYSSCWLTKACGARSRLVLSGEEDRQLALFIQKHFSGYHRLSDQELLDVEKKLQSSGLPATGTQAVCMRNYLYQNATLMNGHLIPDYVGSKEHGYTGAPGDIKRISEALQVPPLQVLRCVVRKRFRLTETYTRRFVESFINQYDEAAGGERAASDPGAAVDSA